MLIKNRALALGFDLVGISPAESHYAEADLFERWLGQGYAGEMNYLERGLLKRKEVERVLPGARSVVPPPAPLTTIRRIHARRKLRAAAGYRGTPGETITTT